MTERQKELMETKMYNLWMQFIYEEAMYGNCVDYKHLDEVIRSGCFIKKYILCERKKTVYWVFILCDGEFGYFDGYKYWNEIPISLAKLLDIEDLLSRKEFTVKNGSYVVNY